MSGTTGGHATTGDLATTMTHLHISVLLILCKHFVQQVYNSLGSVIAWEESVGCDRRAGPFQCLIERLHDSE